MDLDGKMFKWALKETGCQEQFSNQRGIKRFNLYFTLIQKTCLRGEVVLKWTHQLKQKKFPTAQHENQPLVNESRCQGTQRRSQIKEETLKNFLDTYLCSRRNVPGSYRKFGNFSLEHMKYFWELFQVSYCEAHIHLYEMSLFLETSPRLCLERRWCQQC